MLKRMISKENISFAKPNGKLLYVPSLSAVVQSEWPDLFLAWINTKVFSVKYRAKTSRELHRSTDIQIQRMDDLRHPREQTLERGPSHSCSSSSSSSSSESDDDDGDREEKAKNELIQTLGSIIYYAFGGRYLLTYVAYQITACDHSVFVIDVGDRSVQDGHDTKEELKVNSTYGSI